MFDFSLNDNPSVTKLHIGKEHIPLLIIDDFANQPTDLINFAGDGSLFKADPKNFYPGKRLLTPKTYSEELCIKYLTLLKSTFSLGNASCAKSLFSALAISDLAPKQLKPMQMLPHFDTTHGNQIAVVHYLSGSEHGGTSFYQHRSSNFETITEQRLASYGYQLKKEAMANQIHKSPCYINGSNAMFKQIHCVEAKFNRAIIYPSNLLHSGNINPLFGLSSKPSDGRLTIGSFIVFE
jgi:hypothetical protein